MDIGSFTTEIDDEDSHSGPRPQIPEQFSLSSPLLKGEKEIAIRKKTSIFNSKNKLKKAIDKYLKSEEGTVTLSDIDINHAKETTHSYLLKIAYTNVESRIEETTDWAMKIASEQERLFIGARGRERKISIKQVTKNYWEAKTYWEHEVLSQSRFKQGLKTDPPYQVKQFYESEYLGLHITWLETGGIIISDHHNDLIELWSRADILNLIGIISQRALSLLYSDLCCSTSSKECPDSSCTQVIYSLYDQIICKVGNKAFTIIKLHESYCLSIILNKVKEKRLDVNRRMTEWAKTEFKSVGRELGVETLCESISYFLENRLTIEGLVQIFGLYRHWGHPEVSGLDGLEKVLERGTRIIEFSPKTISEMDSDVKEALCTRFKKKKRSWPQCDISNLSPHSEIRRAIENERYPNPTHADYHHSDWGLIKFKQNYPKFTGFDIPLYLDDKSISANVQELIRGGERGDLGLTSETKLLLKFLLSDLTSLESFIEDIDKNGLQENDLVIGLLSKEKELKNPPRKFAKMTFNHRMLQVSREGMSKQALELFEEITVADDFKTTELKKQKIAFDQNRSKDEISVCASMDITAWCGSMREEILYPLLSSLDDLFGFANIFKDIHKNFKKSIVYEADGCDSVDFKEAASRRKKIHLEEENPTLVGDGYFIGLLGGLEGLAQCTWSIQTVILVSRVLKRFGIRYSLMNQGDNILIQLSLPIRQKDENGIITTSERERLTNLVEEILDKLQESFKSGGLTLKREETWASDSVSVYGKDFRVAGRLMPFSMKKISRASHLCNENFPTLENALAAISAACFSSVYYSIDLVPSLCMALIASEICFIELMTNSPLIDSTSYPFANLSCKVDFRGLSESEQGRLILKHEQGNEIHLSRIIIESHSYLSTTIGSLPIPNLIEFSTRGVADPLSRALAFIRLAIESTSIHQEVIDKILRWMNIPISEIKDLEMLCDDPQAINFVNVASQKNIVRDFTKDLLQDSQVVKNKGIKEFVKLATTSLAPLIKDFFKLSPCFPRALKVILDATPEKQAEKLMSKFEKTRTLENLAVRTRGQSLVSRLRRAEVKKRQYIMWRGSRTPIESTWRCSMVYAQSLREISWGREDMIGSTSAPIIEAFKLVKVENSKGCSICNTIPMTEKERWVQSNYILGQLEENMSDIHEIQFTRGSLIPYIGSGTEDKSQKIGNVQLAKVDSRLTSGVRALELIGYICNPDGELASLIKDIFKTITDIEPELFYNPDLTISGTALHRLRDGITDRHCFLSINSTPNMHILISSNTMSSLQRDGSNILLSWQDALVNIGTRLNQSFNDEKESLTGAHLHPDCEDCFTVVVEKQVEVRKGEKLGRKVFDGTVKKNSPFSYFPKETTESLLRPVIKISCQQYESLALDNRDKRRIVSQYAGLECGRLAFQRYLANTALEISTKGGSPFNYVNDVFLSDFCAGFFLMVAGSYMLTILQEQPTEPSNFSDFIDKVLEKISTESEICLTGLSRLVTISKHRRELIKNGNLTYLPNSLPYTANEVNKSCVNILVNYGERLKTDSSAFDNFKVVIRDGRLSTLFDVTTLVGEIGILTCCKQGTIGTKMKNDLLMASRDLTEIWTSLNGIIVMSNILENDTNGYITNIFRESISSGTVICIKAGPDTVLKALNEEEKLDQTHLEQKPKAKTTYYTDEFKSTGGFTGEVLGEVSGASLISVYSQEPKRDKRPAKTTQVLIGDLWKPIKMLTTAVYKWSDLYEICRRFERDQPLDQISLGDGSGGCTRLFLEHNKRGTCLFNTLLKFENCIEDSGACLFPPACDVDHIMNRVIGLKTLESCLSNIEFQPTLESIKREAMNNHFVDARVVCDAEHNTDQVDENPIEKILYAVWDLAKETGPRRLHICKVYFSSRKLIAWTLECGLSYFEKIIVVTSAYSPVGSSEVFLLLKNPLPTQIDKFKISPVEVMRIQNKFKEVRGNQIKQLKENADIKTEGLKDLMSDTFAISSFYFLLEKFRFRVKSLGPNLWNQFRKHLILEYPSIFTSWFLKSDKQFLSRDMKHLTGTETIKIIIAANILKMKSISNKEASIIIQSKNFPGKALLYKRRSGKFTISPLLPEFDSGIDEIKGEFLKWELPHLYSGFDELRLYSRIVGGFRYIHKHIIQQENDELYFPRVNRKIPKHYNTYLPQVGDKIDADEEMDENDDNNILELSDVDLVKDLLASLGEEEGQYE